MQRTLDLATGVLLLTLAVILLLMFASQRSRRELLWLALCCAAVAWTRLAIVLAITMDSTPWDTSFPSSTFSILLLLEFSMAALDYSPRWIRPLAWIVFLWGFFVPVAGAALCVLLPIVLIVSVLRPSGRSMERLFVTFGCAVLLFVHIRTNVLSGLFGISTSPFSLLLRLGPYEINSYPVLLALFTFGMVAVLIRRLLLDREQKQRLANEIEAARAVQQLLLASAPAGDGQWTVDAIYEPAQEVGGDFYQVLSRDDGSRVILVGDVSGKGLNAAMLVSFAVGALQNQTSSSPAAILQAMNTAVNGHARGKFITCCCVRVATDGKVTVASAGHPAPYADGRELPVESGLPLGVQPESAWTETSMTLAPGTQMTLISDGVVEARNPRGELFGFERTREISGSSAAAIAAAAGAWGQDDDITVVTVQRAAA